MLVLDLNGRNFKQKKKTNPAKKQEKGKQRKKKRHKDRDSAMFL